MISSNSGPPTKRKRQGRRNNDQIEYLVDYMLQHPNLASGKFFKINSRNALQGSWEELVKELNEMRSNGQSGKNVKSWKEVGTKAWERFCVECSIHFYFLSCTIEQ